jgi:hypothetical protein
MANKILLQCHQINTYSDILISLNITSLPWTLLLSEGNMTCTVTIHNFTAYQFITPAYERFDFILDCGGDLGKYYLLSQSVIINASIVSHTP